MTQQPTTRSALFVDFDNIYSGLRALDPAAAEAFATDPARWVEWLTLAGDRPGASPRRFLVQVCYLNPNAYSRYRAFFIRSGFRVVDCPPLTAMGKTSADIHIVLDVLEALEHRIRYDEFVIASADADFTPLLYKLRAEDRRATVVTAGPASAAYRAVCDSVILPDKFADAVVGDREDPPVPQPVSPALPSASVVGPPDGEPALRLTGARAAATAVRAAVAAADKPLVSASAAHVARAAYPAIIEDGWAGAGSFSAFVARYVPDVAWAGPSPGYLYDPARHTEVDLPGTNDARGTLGPVPEQVSRVTATPRLTTQQFAVLFEELASDVATNEFSRTGTSRRVRDRSVERGLSVSRAAVNQVLQGLIYSGHGLPAGSSADDLAAAFAKNVLNLCSNAQMELNSDDRQAIIGWIAGEPN